jgi:glycosyltransferase involved in cell wall biosynthesis
VKIVHFIKWLRLRDGGTVKAVIDLCDGLAARGHDVVAASADDDDLPPSWKGSPVPGTPHSLRLDLRDLALELKGRPVSEAVRDTPLQFLSKTSLHAARAALQGADVLHVHGMWANANHQMIRVARSLGVPHVISPHGMLDDWSMAQGRLKKRIHLALASGRSLASARAIHCTATAELDQAARWFPRRKGVVIPLLFDTGPLRSLPGADMARTTFPWLADDRPTVLFLSRVNAKKGPDHLLRALAASKARDLPPWRLVVAGPADPPGYDDALRELARSLRVESDVHFTGMVKGDLKWSLYQACTLFALPTSQENFGYVLLEALACAKPVITTTGVDIWPELESSKAARIIAAQGPALAPALADTIASMLADAPKLEGMGAAGRAWALSFLDHARILDAFEAMYQGR